ncbi:MAG: hypothetical protein ACOCVF_04160 [bacterium]
MYHVDKDTYEDLRTRCVNIINDFFIVSTSNYNQKLRIFEKGEKAYAITTNLQIISCEIIKVNDKNEYENFTYQIIPHGYKISLLTKLKVYLQKKYGYEFSYPFPWGCTPKEGLAGINLFQTKKEAQYCLDLSTLYLFLNNIMLSTKEIIKLKNEIKDNI